MIAAGADVNKAVACSNTITLDGRSRIKNAEKLVWLAPDLSPKERQFLFEKFVELFAYRRNDAIITRRNGGPRDWLTNRWPLTDGKILFHLLGNRIEERSPIWVGTRSFKTTKYIVLDVDADRAPSTASIRQSRAATTRPSFDERLNQAKRCLISMGVNPDDPNQILEIPTPSGGRHLYLFLERPSFIWQVEQHFRETTLQFSPGEIELFPSETKALRLPFGYVPGQAFSPFRWLAFMRDYRNGTIRRFSLEALYEATTSTRRAITRMPPLTSPEQSTSLAGPPRMTRIPRRFQNGTRSPCLDQDATNLRGYDEIVRNGPTSYADIHRLVDGGIKSEGTRIQVLKHLTAHLIFIKGLSSEAAAQQLIPWALSIRHASKDIAKDLKHGRRQVENDILRMCDWYAKHRLPSNGGTGARECLFAEAEVSSLKTSLSVVENIEDRSALATFLVYFLDYAHRFGTASATGWQASPAVKEVMRTWPGCSHMLYKTRLDLAMQINVMQLTKQKWQNPRGKGRARTYELKVPVVPSQERNTQLGVAIEQIARPRLVVPVTISA
jgi:hypothetical protein